MYKKLFKIKYNNKEFQVFVNEDHRYAFMEIKDGKLVAPSLEDFKHLFIVFNTNQGFVATPVKGERLGEQVNYKGLLLSVIYSLTVGTVWGLDVDFLINRDNSIIAQYITEKKEENTFKSVRELNEYLGYQHISLEDVFKVIDENGEFTPRQREITKKILEEKVRRNPNIDLRLIYENMKTLKIELSTYEELSKKYKESIGGLYSHVENKIYLGSDDDGIFAHEISHVMHFYFRVIKGKIVYFGAGRSDFQEYLADIEGEFGIDHEIYGYGGHLAEPGRMFNFLIEHSEKFSFELYDEYGLDPVIEELKEKYPEVDIDYIIDFFNGVYRNMVQIESEDISMYDNEDLLEQVYEMAIASIDRDKPFEQLKLLIELFSGHEDVIKKYSDRYYKELISKGIISQSEFDYINNLNHLVLKDREFYIAAGNNQYFDWNKSLHNLDSEDLCIPLDSEIKDIIMIDYFDGINIFEESYINNLIKDGLLLSNNFLDYMKPYDGETIQYIVDEIFVKMMEGCSSSEEIQQEYGLFDSKLWCIVLHMDNGEPLRDYYFDNGYLRDYLYFCIDSGFSTEEDAALVRDINYVVEYNGKYYLAKSIDYTDIGYDTVNDYNDYSIQRTEVITLPIKITYIDENREEQELVINRGVITYHEITDDGKLLIQSLLIKSQAESLSQDFIDFMMNQCNFVSEDLYANVLKMSDGQVIYDGELDDSITIEFGNYGAEINFRICKDGNVLYERFSSCTPLTSKISYKLFIDNIYYKNGSYMDEILTQESIREGLVNLEPLMKDIKVEWGFIEHEAFALPTENTAPQNEWGFDVTFQYPVVINVDGQNYYERDINVTINSRDGNLYVNYPDGTSDFVMNVFDVNNPDYGLDERFFVLLEDYLAGLNLEFNEDDIACLTKEQIRDIVKEDFNKIEDDEMVLG